MNITKWFKGKKTYIIAATTIGVSVAMSAGITIPAWVYPLLIALGGASTRAAIEKAGLAPTSQEKLRRPYKVKNMVKSAKANKGR